MEVTRSLSYYRGTESRTWDIMVASSIAAGRNKSVVPSASHIDQRQH
jgi:hypothetical protein